jgi:hypothetical protein
MLSKKRAPGRGRLTEAGHRRPTGPDVRQGTGRRGTHVGGYGRARDGRGGRLGAFENLQSGPGPGLGVFEPGAVTCMRQPVPGPDHTTVPLGRPGPSPTRSLSSLRLPCQCADADSEEGPRRRTFATGSAACKFNQNSDAILESASLE